MNYALRYPSLLLGFICILSFMNTGYANVKAPESCVENRGSVFTWSSGRASSDALSMTGGSKPSGHGENLRSFSRGRNYAETQMPERAVTGRVTDSLNHPLPGVTVSLESNPSMGTTTDLNGMYVLNVKSDAERLKFSYVGYITKMVAAKGRNVINVILSVQSAALDQVVVVAFGEQKKSDMVGSVTSISAADLAKTPSSNLTTALAGRIPGMIAYQRSGEPGADNANFFIRGVTSFGNGSANPLILIDGVELSVTDLANLRPDNIESFTVLKDATATAVYGSRAGNGVILIKTKEGKEGKATVSFRVENSVSMPTRNIQLADPVTYMRLYDEGKKARDPFADPYYNDEKIISTEDKVNQYAFPAVDWRKELFKNSTMDQRYDLNVSGGGKVARYYISGSLTQDNGLLRVDNRNNFNNNINQKLYTLLANVNVNLTKTTQVAIKLNGNFDDYTGPISSGAAMYNEVINTSPVDFPAFYPADSAHAYLQHIMFGGRSDKTFTNPYADMVKGYKSHSRSLMVAQLELKQDLSFLVPDLKFRVMMNTNRISSFDIVRSYMPFFYEMTYYDSQTDTYSLNNFNQNSGTEYLDYNMPSKLQSQSFYLESELNYEHSFNKKSRVSGLLVYLMQSSLNADATSLQLSLPSRNVGLSGRATYSYDDRYFAEFDFGYNGSERFYRNKRFGFFPSIGGAWSVSNEKFWKPIKNVLTDFRLRATYGLVGNDQIGSATDRFFYLSEVNMNDAARKGQFGYNYGYTQNGITVTRYSNTDITWEVAHKLNLGLDLGIFNDLSLNLDVYSEVRKNILMDRAFIPVSLGLSAPVRANVGEASGRGVDLAVNYSHYFSNKLWLKLQGTFTYAASKYKVYEEPDYKSQPWLSKIGLPISQQFGYIAERLFVDSSEVNNSPPQNFGSKVLAGDVKYKDVNGDGQITALDEVPIGYPTTPEIVYGFGFSFGYGSFDVSTFFQGLGRESFFIDPIALQPFVNGGRQIIKAFADSHYTLDNQNIYALWPRFSTTVNDNNTQPSTWWLRNGSFIRLKQAEIGWSMPQDLIKRISVDKVRFYINGSNLFLISRFHLWDVEMSGNGLGYPIQRVFNVGANIVF